MPFFLSFLYIFFLLVKIFQWFSDYPPDENSWIRTGTLNEYMS